MTTTPPTGFFKRLLSGLKEASLRSFDDHFKFERELLMGELCRYLHEINVKATLLEPNNSEAFRYPPYVLGHVKIEGRNVDAILVQYSSSGGGDSDGDLVRLLDITDISMSFVRIWTV
jgi:hypothetical protein